MTPIQGTQQVTRETELSTFEGISGDFTWQEAQSECQAIGKELASIHSQEEQTYIRNFIIGDD